MNFDTTKIFESDLLLHLMKIYKNNPDFGLKNLCESVQKQYALLENFEITFDEA